MQSKLALLWAALLLFHGAVSLPALWEVGYLGLFEHALATWPARQVFSDLAMALIPLNMWITKDARERNVAAWPVWVGSVALGSVAPLTYLLWRSLRVPATQVTRPVPA